MNEETIYERWDLLQEFLAAIDPELRYSAVSHVEVKPGVIEVTVDRPTEVGGLYQAEEVKRSYRFAARTKNE